MGAAAAILQLVLIVVTLVLWRVGEWLVARIARSWLVAGPSRSSERCLSPLARAADAIVFGIGLAGLVAIALWSVAGIWRFPAALPRAFSLASWRWAASGLATATWTTLAVGVLTSLVAVVVVLACLEHEARAGERREARVLALVYLPLLLPQIAFLKAARCCWSGSISTGRL